MPNPWAGRAAKSEELEPKKDTETESENTQGDLAEIKADVSLDALQADVIKAESKEEIEEDLNFLQKDLETTNPVSTFQSLNTLGKPIEKLTEEEQVKLAEVDYTVGRYMVGNLMSTLMLKHKGTTGRIDEAAFRESLAKLNISTWRGLQTELLNNKIILSPAEQELFAAFDKGGKFVNSYFTSHYQQEVVAPWIQAMPQCVVAYNQYYAQPVTGVAPEVKGLIDDLKTKGFKETMVTNKPFKNAVLVGGVLAGVVGAYSLIRSWTGKKRNKKGIIGGLLTAALTGTAAAAIGGGLTYRWMKEKEGKKLTFEESLLALQSDVQNKLSEESLRTHIGVVRYDELTKELMSYGLGTVIDKDAKKIPGLNVQFSDYKQMLHVASLINYIKFTYKGRCRSTTPFFTGGTTGDVYIKTVKNEKKDQEDEIISGGRWSTLRSFCPDLDSLWGGGAGKEKLVQYLNSQPGRQQHDAVAQADTGEDKVEDLANNIQNDIEKAIPEVKLGGARGSLKVEKLSDETNYYQVESWDGKTYFTAKEIGKKKEIAYFIDNLDIKFETAEECIRVANLINMTKKEFAGKCKDANPFFRNKMGHDGKAIYVYSKGSKGMSAFNILSPLPFVGDGIRGKKRGLKTTFLDNSSIKEDYPTLENTSQRNKFIDYLNNQKDANGSSLRYAI